ncbi:heterokaryon incompatibility protein [Rutstroemia sp. NJR-2017a WRK4]|nr:heterokaryon incompatibility protein [Rutstroemia sp. NJR-2017a WRK4]
MASLDFKEDSKDTSNKPKRGFSRHVLRARQGELDLSPDPEIVPQECPPETESANKKPKLPCLNRDKLLELKPFKVEEWSEDLGENMFGDDAWQSSWARYLHHNNRLLTQGKEFVTPHTLCLVCKTICTHPKLLEWRWAGIASHSEPCPPHYETIEELIISASEGCHMCSMILYDKSSIPDRYPRDGFRFDFEGSGSGSHTPLVNLVTGSSNSGVGSFIFYPHSDPKLPRNLHSTQRSVHLSPTENISPWRTSTLSEETFQLARAWLTECTSHHELCNSVVDLHDLPTRLIHIAGEDNETFKVRLCVSKDLNLETQYLTLSHVWGDLKNQFTLKTSNFEELVNEGICWQRLPKTFQDAVLITHRLGFEYLWIDSLCIIQDSIEDWNNEAPRMASVYGNSTCNIAALGKDSHAGCFRDRNPLSHSLCRILSSDWGDIYFSTDKSGIFDNNYMRLINGSPLFKRAWVFQERILAQRTIYFGDSQIHWECGRGSACEISPLITSIKANPRFEFPSGQKTSIGIIQGYPEFLKEPDVQRSWQHLVLVYNPLLLTVVTDKLIALSAITKLFERRFGLTYLNGLWKEHLPSGLLWFISYRDSEHNFKHPVSEIPSWSWAAMTSDTGSHKLLFSYSSTDRRKRKTDRDARVLGYHGVRNTTTDRDFFGNLMRYSLTLRGWIKPVKYLITRPFCDDPLITRNEMTLLGFISVEGKKRLNISIHLDTWSISESSASTWTPCETDPDFYYLRDSQPGSSDALPEGYKFPNNAKEQFREVCLMLIYGHDDNTSEGLILEEYGTNPNHYVRVGYFSHRRYKRPKRDKAFSGYHYESLFEAEHADVEERTIELF